MPTTFKAALGAVILGALSHSGAWAQCVGPSSVDGRWTADDHGTYYIRQMGNEFVWVGTSADGHRRFADRFLVL